MSYAPIAPICCVDGLTVADMRELEVLEIRTVLGLLPSWPDCPNAAPPPAAAA